MTEGIPRKILKGMPKRTLERIPETISERILERVNERKLEGLNEGIFWGKNPEAILGAISEGILNISLKRCSFECPCGILEGISREICEKTLEEFLKEHQDKDLFFVILAKTSL